MSGARGRRRERGRSGRGRPTPKTGLGGERLEGHHAVSTALTAGRRRVREIWTTSRSDSSPFLEQIRAEADRSGIPVNVVDPDEIDRRAVTDAPQGVVARADPVPEAAADELLDDPGAFLVALDGVTDPGNLGAVLRSAEAAGATGVLLPKRRSAHLTPAAAKAAAGAIEYLPIALVAGIPSALDRASRAGLWTVGLDGAGEVALFDFELADQPLVLVLGAEGGGLAPLTRERCDALVRIPMRGSLGSLNVAAAAALACYEVARRRLPGAQ